MVGRAFSLPLGDIFIVILVVFVLAESQTNQFGGFRAVYDALRGNHLAFCLVLTNFCWLGPDPHTGTNPMKSV